MRKKIWKEIKIKEDTATKLLFLKQELNYSTYDEIVFHLLDFYTTRKWSA